ncbi:MAG: type IX secretion system membrane protein PorP/SprF [Opitutaceae bacterium]|nr:type IX secretion system membrane protein PorP/SprF [Cytophagales bacterium]
MKKVIVAGFLLVLLSFISQAQQRAQYSQYMINQYVLNPALTGTYDYAHIVAGYRNQWVGNNFEGAAPVTYYLSGHTSIARGSRKPHPYRNKHAGYHSVGGMIYNDQTGPTSRMGIQGSYAYNERISGNWRASLGVFLGVMQYSLNTSKLHFAESEAVSSQTRLVPDGSIGGWVYNKHVYVGVAVSQIFQSRLNFDIPATGQDVQGVGSKLANHYFITSGIKIDVAPDWAVVPSIMLKYNNPAPVSIDINGKVRYKDMVWVGASYRNLDSFTALFGFVIGKQLEFGYSYDYTISKINAYTSGSHEVLLGLRLWPRARLDCPSNFW